MTPAVTPLLELALWIPVGVIPIANGAVRLLTYERWLCARAASLLSSTLDVVAVAAFALLVQRRRPVTDHAAALARGALWVSLTTLAHFALGAFLFELPLATLVAKYDVAGGETWALVSLAIAAAPLAAWRLAPPTRLSAC